MAETTAIENSDACPDCGTGRASEYRGDSTLYILWKCGRVEDETGRVSRKCGGELVRLPRKDFPA